MFCINNLCILILGIRTDICTYCIYKFKHMDSIGGLGSMIYSLQIYPISTLLQHQKQGFFFLLKLYNQLILEIKQLAKQIQFAHHYKVQNRFFFPNKVGNHILTCSCISLIQLAISTTPIGVVEIYGIPNSFSSFGVFESLLRLFVKFMSKLSPFF